MKEFPKLVSIDKIQLDELIHDSNYTFERKYDGTACQMVITEQGTNLIGRGKLKDGSQQNFTHNFPELLNLATISECKSCTLFGEIWIGNLDNTDNFPQLQTRTIRKFDIELFSVQFPAKFMIFDISEYNNEDVTQWTFVDRKELLYTIIRGTSNIIPSISGRAMKAECLSTVLECNYEGIVAKHKDAMFGLKQFKFKPTLEADVFCTGEYIRGRGRNEGLVGSLVCYEYINGVKTEVAKVRGFDDILCKMLTIDIKNETISADNPLVIEVIYNEILSSGKLRFPRFSRIRTDKSAEQCIRN